MFMYIPANITTFRLSRSQSCDHVGDGGWCVVTVEENVTLVLRGKYNYEVGRQGRTD